MKDILLIPLGGKLETSCIYVALYPRGSLIFINIQILKALCHTFTNLYQEVCAVIAEGWKGRLSCWRIILVYK